MKKIVFVHIPKTAGTTFNSILQTIYQEEERFHVTAGSCIPADFQYDSSMKIIDNLDVNIIKNISLIHGHMPYVNLENKFENFEYITFLRNPIDRVISDYNYIKTTVSNPMYHIVNSMSLGDYVKRHTDLQLDNLQTRLITGKIKGELTKDDLDLALYNIKYKFSAVGLTEHFESSIILMKNIFEWGDIPTIQNKNITKRKDSIDTDTLEVIKKFNEFDIQLYDFYLKDFYEITRTNNIKIIKGSSNINNQTSFIKNLIKKIVMGLGYRIQIIRVKHY